MANTFSQCFYHFVFSTKARSRFIYPEIETRVWEYIGGLAKNHKMKAVQVGGIEDHIHSLVMANPKCLGDSSVADATRLSCRAYRGLRPTAKFGLSLRDGCQCGPYANESDYSEDRSNKIDWKPK